MPSIDLPKNLSGYNPNEVGLVTHAAIQILAPALATLDPRAIPEHALDVTGALVNGNNVNRRRVLMLTAAGHVSTYLRRFAPTDGWELLECEFDTGQGRTDLAWRHTVTDRVFFDEIKTHNRAVNEIASRVITQVKRQGEGGKAMFGDLFAGVRLIPFGALHLTTLVHPDHKRMRIAPTPHEPLRPAAQSPSVPGGLA